MSENKLAPRIKFYQNHRTAIDPGEYSIAVDAEITHAKINGNNKGTITRRFAVYGERFSLNDQDVRGVFPAAGSTGEYSSILPHIILHRNTLPWERHAFATDKNLPWLALLLFDEDEVPVKSIVSVKDLFSQPPGADQFANLPREVAQHDDEKLTVIDVPKTVLQEILPNNASLLLLAHTRQGVDENGDLFGEENATVLCNRLPAQGNRSTMHLVSVEGRYDASGFQFGAGNMIRLVSLKSWEFYTIEHFKISSATLTAIAGKAPAGDAESLSTLLDREFAGTRTSFLEQVAHEVGLPAIPESYKAELIAASKFDKTFDGLLTHLNKDILTLRLPHNKNVDAEKLLSQGLVPLRHNFRNGDQSVSWYRSPFVPFQPANRSTVNDLQPQTADELTQFDAEHGLFDVTYSAAWEIGRLLALANKEFSVNLLHWQRQTAQRSHVNRQLDGTQHLPILRDSDHNDRETILWDRLQPFLKQLVTFQNIPATYLVPDEKLLPAESIRFFYVDRNWQAAAIAGALSVSGVWEDQNSAKATIRSLITGSDAVSMGFLLRSDVVDGWPGILINGVDTDNKNLDAQHRQLSKNVLLGLFQAEVSQVIFHQKPEVMHFGFLQDNDTFQKRRRDANGDETEDPLDVDWQSKQTRVIAMDKMAATLDTADNPAQFAMNMVEGVPNVRFDISIPPEFV